jgi:hypothetical protein
LNSDQFQHRISLVRSENYSGRGTLTI